VPVPRPEPRETIRDKGKVQHEESERLRKKVGNGKLKGGKEKDDQGMHGGARGNLIMELGRIGQKGEDRGGKDV